MTKNYDVSAAVEEMAPSQQQPQPEDGRRTDHGGKTQRRRQHHHHNHHRWSWLAISYVVSGALHELFHILAAKALGYPIFSNGTIPSLFGMLFGRTTILPSLGQAEEFDVALVRHAGWIGSLIVYLSIYLVVSHNATNHHQQSQVSAPQNSFNLILKNLRSAALVTLLEALTTDLRGLSVLGGKTIFCCGNFGVIILNNAWVQTPGDNGKTALDLLEKMISITMMRGGTY